MSKTKEQKRLDSIETRVRALEAHNGWVETAHDDDEDQSGQGHVPQRGDADFDESRPSRDEENQ